MAGEMIFRGFQFLVFWRIDLAQAEQTMRPFCRFIVHKKLGCHAANAQCHAACHSHLQRDGVNGWFVIVNRYGASRSLMVDEGHPNGNMWEDELTQPCLTRQRCLVQ